jgi:heme/copper-type cytochrome/quinol oxidase subunit 3
MSEPRRVLDVSSLPTVTFDHRGLTWWGTVGFMVIEGFTTALMAASYLYLRKNELAWPPGHTPNPDLLAASLNTALLLLVMIPMRSADLAARRFDRRAVARWLSIATVMSVGTVVLRWYELVALNARWDAHAYGSAAWGVLVMHGTLILVDCVETGTMAVLFAKGPIERKRFPDASDAAAYQYFLSLAQIPVYLIVFWGPRVL